MHNFLFSPFGRPAAATDTDRFLFRQKLTHQRTRNFLTVMMKLKKAKNLDKRLEAVVDNAFYTCCPPERWV